MAISDWMLFPNELTSSYRVQVLIVFDRMRLSSTSSHFKTG
jgi:hypothetical protein